MRLSLWSLIGAITLFSAACGGCDDDEGESPEEVAFSEVIFETCGNGIDDDENGLTDCEERICQRHESCRFEPADPSSLAGPVGVADVSKFYESVKFLVEGENSVVKGVDLDRLNKSDVSVVRAQILDREFQPLQGVRARIPGKTQYGYTFSRPDGWVDFVINASEGETVIRFEDDNVLGVDAEVEAQSNAFSNGRTVVATPQDSVVTRVRAGEAALIDSTPVSDDDGARTSRAFVQEGTKARVRLADGRIAVLDEFNVRATEYTVGESGPAAMPGLLPGETGYTYAVEMSIDELRDVEIDTVEFDKPVSLYVDNFLGFPVGSVVPSGTYDRQQTNSWVPNDNGVVVAIVDGGFDVDGDGSKDSGEALSSLGITGEEVRSVVGAYGDGTELWRAPVVHFSPHDLNWPTEFPPDAIPLDPDEIPDFPPEPEQDPCEQSGSIIECENRVVAHALPVPGTNFSLWYRSDRVPGRGRSLVVRLSGDSVPNSLKRIEAKVMVAGREFTHQVDPGPNLDWTFDWDGTNAYGQTVAREVPVRVQVDYIYDVSYVIPANAEQAFGVPGQTLQELREARIERAYSQVFRGRLGAYDNRAAFGMAGWALDVQSFYNGNDRSLLLPDRPAEKGAANVSNLIRTLTTWSAGDDQVFDMFALSDGRVALVTGLAFSLRKVYIMDTDGNVEEVGGNLLAEGEFLDECFLGMNDCGVGSDASRWKFVGTVDAGPDDALYFLNSGCIRRLDIDAGVYEEHAGSCNGDYERYLTGLSIAACDHGTFIGGGEEIFRVNADGTATAVAGRPEEGDEEYDPTSVPGAVATDVYINDIGQMACGVDGNLFWIDQMGSIIELTPQGTLEVEWANDGNTIGLLQLIDSIEGGPLAVGREQDTVRLWKADDGALNLIAGSLILDLVGLSDEEQERRQNGDNVPAVDVFFATLYATTQFDDGRILIQDTSSNSQQSGDRYREIVSSTPSLSGSGIRLIDPDGSVLTAYDGSGRPEKMINVRTGVEVLTFEYDEMGLLSGLVNPLGERVTIERDANGAPSAIEGYFGLRTDLEVNQAGFLSGVTYADGSSRIFETDDNGLITAYVDGRGQRTEYEFAADGGLARVDHPDGSWKTFEAGRSTVTMETSDGRSMVYARGDSGFTARQTTDAAGRTWQRTRTIDGVTTTLRPDGVVTRTSRSDDPRFGGQARYTSSMEIEQPNGLVSRTLVERQADYNPEDLLDVEQTRDLLTVNDKTWESVYDTASRTLTMTSPEGRTQTAVFDEFGRVLRAQAGSLDPLEYTYDGSLKTSMTWGEFETSATYDGSGFLTRFERKDGQGMDLGRDPVGRVLSSTTESSQYDFEFDGQGNMTSVSTPSSWITNEFDPLNRLSSMSWADGTEFTFDWGMDSRLVSATAPGVTPITTVYDAAGRIEEATSGTAQVSFVYDQETGQILSTTADDVVQTFGYSGSLRTRFETSIGALSASIERDFDADFRVSRRTISGQVVDHTFDDDGLLVAAGELQLNWAPDVALLESTEVAGITKTITYRSTGLPESITWERGGTVLFEEVLEFDNALRVQSTGSHEYTYDGAGRLTGWSLGGTQQGSYTYDERGNRLSANGEAQTYDAAGRLQGVGAVTYNFDAAGRLQSRNGGGINQSFEFDGFNRMTGATDSGVDYQYNYDTVGRLVSRSTNGVVDFVYLYDDSNRPRAEVNSSGDVESVFVYGERESTPAYMVRNGQTYVFVTDYLGSVRQVVDESGTVVQELTYDPWGRVLNDTNPGFQPFGFASGLTDPDTGLVTFGVRHYDPLAGRWISPDPLGLGGGVNLWVYAANSPTTFVDPDGEVPIFFIVGVAVVISGGVYVANVKATAYSAGNDAVKIGKRAGGGDGPVDALRHCTMNCRMTRVYGRPIAKLASWYHESPLDADLDNVGTPANIMDEKNNACGRDIADTIPSDQSCLNACEEALFDGRLDVLPASEWKHGDVTPEQMQADWSQWQKDGVRSERYGPFW